MNIPRPIKLQSRGTNPITQANCTTLQKKKLTRTLALAGECQRNKKYECLLYEHTINIIALCHLDGRIFRATCKATLCFGHLCRSDHKISRIRKTAKQIKRYVKSISINICENVVFVKTRIE